MNRSKLTCPQKRDHFKRKVVWKDHHFWGASLVFRRVSWISQPFVLNKPYGCAWCCLDLALVRHTSSNVATQQNHGKDIYRFRSEPDDANPRLRNDRPCDILWVERHPHLLSRCHFENHIFNKFQLQRRMSQNHPYPHSKKNLLKIVDLLIFEIQGSWISGNFCDSFPCGRCLTPEVSATFCGQDFPHGSPHSIQWDQRTTPNGWGQRSRPILRAHNRIRWKMIANASFTLICHLGGGFNPFEKYARQIGSFPQIGMKIKNVWNHHLGHSFGFGNCPLFHIHVLRTKSELGESRWGLTLHFIWDLSQKLRPSKHKPEKRPKNKTRKGMAPCQVTTRMNTFELGNPDKNPSFAIVTGVRGTTQTMINFGKYLGVSETVVYKLSEWHQ